MYKEGTAQDHTMYTKLQAYEHSRTWDDAQAPRRKLFGDDHRRCKPIKMMQGGKLLTCFILYLVLEQVLGEGEEK
jgi:hypothetical protein